MRGEKFALEISAKLYKHRVSDHSPLFWVKIIFFKDKRSDNVIEKYKKRVFNIFTHIDR